MQPNLASFLTDALYSQLMLSISLTNFLNSYFSYMVSTYYFLFAKDNHMNKGGL